MIAIELLAACQAIEFLRPLKTTVPLEECYKVVRSVVRYVQLFDFKYFFALFYEIYNQWEKYTRILNTLQTMG